MASDKNATNAMRSGGSSRSSASSSSSRSGTRSSSHRSGSIRSRISGTITRSGNPDRSDQISSSHGTISRTVSSRESISGGGPLLAALPLISASRNTIIKSDLHENTLRRNQISNTSDESLDKRNSTSLKSLNSGRSIDDEIVKSYFGLSYRTFVFIVITIALIPIIICTCVICGIVLTKKIVATHVV
ncbi:hypothetical protein GJ496_003074 [Pomphorhynchus laevis]|nr:hypothetical protein GJ496_003074 [Pomphorhynchus laevis]